MKKIKSLVLLAFLMFTSSGCGDDYIDSVKNGVFPRYSKSVTLGNALEYWAKIQNCDSTKWEKIITERKEIVVSFSCVIEKDSYPINREVESFNSKYTNKMASYEEEIKDNKKRIQENLNNPNIPGNYLISLNSSILTTEKKMNSLKVEKELFFESIQQFDKLEYLFQFLVAADGESFNIGFVGTEFHYLDGKSYSIRAPYNLLLEVYKGRVVFSELSSYFYENRG